MSRGEARRARGGRFEVSSAIHEQAWVSLGADGRSLEETRLRAIVNFNWLTAAMEISP